MYCVVWGLLFAAPLLSLYAYSLKDDNVTFGWTAVLIVWLAVVSVILVYCACILVRNSAARHGMRGRLSARECDVLGRGFADDVLSDILVLIDTDRKKAKGAVRGLSGMVRYMYGESGKPTVHLYHELEFIRHYVWLMQLHHSGSIRISLELPSVPDCEIPPLVLFGFVEDAFRHCGGGQGEPFVDVKASVEDDVLRFSCRSSKAADGQAAADASCEAGGERVSDILCRLRRLYGNRYTLRTEDTPDSLSQELTIPLWQPSRKAGKRKAIL